MNYWVYMLTIACIYVGLATSLNLVSGYTGILSVCQAAFFGIGAYASALLTLNAGWPWLVTLPVAVVLAIGPAAIVGSLALRLKNDYLIVATFAVQVILVRVMQSWFQVTQGELGVSGVPPVRVGSWVVDTSADGLLLEDDLIEAVVGLGANLFYGTGIPAAVLFIDRNKPAARKGKVLIVNGEKDIVPGTNQNSLSEENVARMAEAVHRYEDEELFCRVADLNEIRDNDHNLNITRYVSTAKPEPIIDLGKTHDAIVAADKDIRTMTAKHNEFLKQLGLPELPTVQPPRP